MGGPVAETDGDARGSFGAAARSLGTQLLVATFLLAAASWSAWTTGSFLGIGAVDHHGTLWTHATFARAAAERDPGLLLDARDFFHPAGQAWLPNTGGNVLDALLALPFAGLDRVTGHNLALLVVLLLNGLAAGWAARRVGGSSWPALLAGTFAAWPLYEIVEGRPAQALLAPAFLAAASVVAVARGGASGVAAGAWLAVTGFGYWYHGLCATLAATAWLVAVGAPVRRVLVTLGTAGLLVSPLVLPLLAGQLSGAGASTEGMLLHAFDPSAWKVGMLDGDTISYTQRGLSLTFVGVGAAWLVRARPSRSTWAWLVPAALLVLLACGPVVRLPGFDVPNPLWTVAGDTPPLQRWAHPARALGILAVLGILGLVLLPRAWAFAAAALLLVESALAGLLPLPTWSPAVPPAYACLAAPGDGAVVELPWPPSPRTLGWQPVHGRPILGGMWNLDERFQRPEAVQLLAEPGVAGLLSLSRTGNGTADFVALAARGYRWVVLLRDALPDPVDAPRRALRRRIETGLLSQLGEPVYEDVQTTVWAPLGDPLPCGSVTAPATEPLPPVRDRRVLDLGSRPAAAAASPPGPAGARRD